MSVFKRWNGTSWEIVGPTISNSRINTIEELIAPEYDPNVSYSVGDFVVYNDTLYKCNTAISSGGELWNSAHWTETKIENEVSDLKNVLNDITGVTKIENWKKGKRINTSQDTVDYNNPDSSQSYDCNVVNCSAGDVFTLTGKAAHAYYRLWCWCKDNGDVVDKPTVGLEYTLQKIVAPIGATKLIVNVLNNTTPYALYRGEIISTQITTEVTEREAADSEIKSEISTTQKCIFNSPIAFDKITTDSEWTIGVKIVPNTGSNVNDTKYCRTGYISFSKNILLYINSNNYDYIVWEYTADNIESAAFAPRQTYENDPVIITPENSAVYFKLGVTRKDGADITQSDITALTSAVKTYILTDTTLSLANIPADAQTVGVELNKKIGYKGAVTSSDDMHNLTDPGVYAYTSGSRPINAPNESSGATVLVMDGFIGNQGYLVQIVSTYSGKMFQEMYRSDGTWTEWSEISAGSGAGGTVIENTYNITTSPTITTDTNGWLQAVDTNTEDETGKTDMTGAIMSMLTDTGYCHLGEGIFYVSGNIDMPEGSTLCGCGKNSVIRLLQSTTTGYCVKISKFSTIKDVSFEGAYSFTVPNTKGLRNGIAFIADYDASTSVATRQCMISNIWCKYFSGAGIYCHNTSTRYDRGIYVTNAFISYCYVGIDIDYISEFNRFTNICTSWCKYGCINNGGNNYFVSCTFHATDTGFYVDGTQYNASHGVIDSCIFAHIGSNNGCAIHIENALHGFIISNTYAGNCYIDIVDSEGIIFSGCEFLKGIESSPHTLVNISGGTVVMFNGCLFPKSGDYVINSDNDKLKMVACFEKDSGDPPTVTTTY